MMLTLNLCAVQKEAVLKNQCTPDSNAQLYENSKIYDQTEKGIHNNFLNFFNVIVLLFTHVVKITLPVMFWQVGETNQLL